jgi:hypothetical protein
VLVGQKVPQRRQQEGPEASAIRIRRPERAILQQHGEERLCEVLCVVGIRGPAPDVGINRKPVRLA